MTFWRRMLVIANALHWPWLARQAKQRRFRAELRLQKLDLPKLHEKTGATSDERDAAVEEGIGPKVPRVRRAKAPKAARSVNGGA